MTSAEYKYLTAINELYDGTAGIRLTAIAEKMKVTKVSAYKAAERLENHGHIRRDEKSRIVLTDSGREQLNKYRELIDFLSGHLQTEFGISAETAVSDAIGAACSFSEESRTALLEHIVKSCE